VIAVDCRGHGESGKPRDPDAHGREVVEDLVRLLDHLRIGEVAVVRYSMGAEIGLRLTVEHPDRVRSLVVGGSGWSGLADAETYHQLAASLERHASFGPVVRARTPTGQPEPKAEEIAKMDQMLKGQDIAALASVARGMDNIIGLSPEEVSAITLPVLGISGEYDPERGNLEKFVGVLPDYTLKILAGQDHISAAADPQSNGSIVEFLSAER